MLLLLTVPAGRGAGGGGSCSADGIAVGAAGYLPAGKAGPLQGAGVEVAISVVILLLLTSM